MTSSAAIRIERSPDRPAAGATGPLAKAGWADLRCVFRLQTGWEDLKMQEERRRKISEIPKVWFGNIPKALRVCVRLLRKRFEVEKSSRN